MIMGSTRLRLPFNLPVIASAALLALLAAAVGQYIWLLLMVVIILLAYQLFGSDVLLFTVTVGFIALPNDIGTLFRDVFNVLSILLLFWLWYKRDGEEEGHSTRVPAFVQAYLIAIIASMAVSSLLSANISVGLGETLRTVVFFMLWSIYVSLTSHQATVKLLLAALVFAGLLVAIPIIYGFLTSPNAMLDLARNAFTHEGGFFSNVGAAGGLLLVSIALSVLYYLIQAEGFWHKSAVALVIAIQTAGLLLTNSRGAILGLTVAMLCLLAVLRRRFLLTRLLPVVSAVILVIIISPAADEYINLYFRTDRVFENTRYVLWDMIFSMVKDNPVFGIGPGGTKLSLEKYLNVMYGTWQYTQIEYVFEKGGLGQAHNFVLFRWAENGIAGLLTALALPFVFLTPVFRLLRRTSAVSEKKRQLVAGFGCIFIGMFARSVVEATGLLSNGWITRDLPVWLIFAVTLHLYSRAKSSQAGGGHNASA